MSKLKSAKYIFPKRHFDEFCEKDVSNIVNLNCFVHVEVIRNSCFEILKLSKTTKRMTMVLAKF